MVRLKLDSTGCYLSNIKLKVLKKQGKVRLSELFALIMRGEFTRDVISVCFDAPCIGHMRARYTHISPMSTGIYSSQYFRASVTLCTYIHGCIAISLESVSTSFTV